MWVQQRVVAASLVLVETIEHPVGERKILMLREAVEASSVSRPALVSMDTLAADPEFLATL